MMPNYKGHLIGGAAAYGIGLFMLVSITASAPSWLTGTEWLLCALGGALFPDVDIKSKGQKYFYRIMLGILLFFVLSAKMALFIMFALLSLTPLIVRHRGIFHKGWFIVLLCTVLALFLVSSFPKDATIIVHDLFFFILGALSHLWLDLGFKGMVRL
jgi:hypothetical protein